MKLNEFFKDKNFNTNNPERDLEEKIDQEKIKQLQDDIFNYALEDDEIHKRYFIPLAKELSNKIKNNSLNISAYSKKFMPLVNAACVEYHKKNKMKRTLQDLFPKKMRVELCHRLMNKSIEDIKNQEYKLESKFYNKTHILNEGLGLDSDRNFEFVEEFNHRRLYVTKEKFQKKYFIAASANPRTGVAEIKESGSTKEEAIKNLKIKIINMERAISKAPPKSGVDFNIAFSEKMIKDPEEPFYIKIIPGPKLVIAGPTITEFPELLKDEKFRKVQNRLPGTSYNFFAATNISGITELYANGRYLIGLGIEDRDGNMVYPLYFDSIVQDTREKIKLKEPALTVNSPRISESLTKTVPLSKIYERKINNLIKILKKK